jgi:eukaryotic-like serine/threonine-protein kinase
VPMSGGAPITLTRIESTGARGATWATDNTIVVATNSVTSGLWLVPVAGGTATPLTRLDKARGEAQHLWPERLPGGRAVLFTITAQTGGRDAAQVAVVDLATRTQKVLLHGGSHAQYLSSGHLVYTAAGALWAVPFDLKHMEAHGTGALVVPRVRTTGEGGGDFAVADDGTLVYVDVPDANATDPPRTLTWVDRTGKEESIPAPPRGYIFPRVSPDGSRLALDLTAGPQRGVWIWDFQRRTLTPLTLDSALNRDPEWTRDGRRIIYTSNRGGVDNLWWQAADGTGTPELLAKSPNIQFATGSTPDGASLLFFERRPDTAADLLQLALDGSGRVTPLVQTPAVERNGIVSEDGHWLAYESDRSGRFEIYVRPFPKTNGGEWQISTDGGTRPLWARDGTELFYVALAGNALMSAPVQVSGGSWHAGRPVKLFDGYVATNPNRTYDVGADGRFLMIKSSAPGPAGGPTLVVVQHWDEEIRRLAPKR